MILILFRACGELATAKFMRSVAVRSSGPGNLNCDLLIAILLRCSYLMDESMHGLPVIAELWLFFFVIVVVVLML